MQDRTRGTVEMSSAMLISGTIGWFVLLSGQPVMSTVFWRCSFGALALLVICAALGFLRRDIMSARQFGVAALGGVALVLNWLLLFGSYSRASISIATAVYNTQPFMLVALGALLLGERLTRSKLAWLCTAFGGMLLIVQAKPNASYVGTDYTVGIAMALGAAALYAAAAIITKKLKGVPPHLIALIQVTVGVAMLAPLGALSTLPTGASSWATLIALGVIHTGVMYILLYGAIQKLPTNLIGALTFIYPVAAIAVDFLAFGHRLHAAQLAGAAAILMSAAGMTLGWTLPVRARKAAPALQD
jgi:drug/metabolite transporter (DMT)-like permease